MLRLFFLNGIRYFTFDMLRLGSQMSQSFHCNCFITIPLLKSSTHYKPIASRHYASKKYQPENRVATIDTFSQVEEKTKGNYLDLLHFYKNKDIYRRGHVEFIYAALKYMKEFGVEKDLEVYKSLIDVMPKGKFVAQNILQAEFQHYPKQQQCMIDLLEQMELNGVCPDEEIEDVLINVFGRRSHAIRRYWRMMYWMPKMRNLSPWPVPEVLPDSSLELAKLAIQRITSIDPSTKLTVFESKDVQDAIDDTWIVSAQSASQQELITKLKEGEPLFVEGSFRVWLRAQSVNYFILRADPDLTPKPEEDPDDISNLSLPLFEQPSETQVANISVVHEQEDGTILAVCATGSSSKDSLLSWIRLLQKENPRLGDLPVLFTFKSPIGSTEAIKEIEGEDPVPATVVDSTTVHKQ